MQQAGCWIASTEIWFLVWMSACHLRADDLPLLLEDWVRTDTAAVVMFALVTLYVFIEDKLQVHFSSLPDYGSTFPVAEAHCGLVRAVQGLLAAL